MPPAIEATGLRKSYGSREVLHGIDLAVDPGEVFALLGPNGAGKTTAVEILEGYRERSGGSLHVLGSDPWKAPASFRARIGIVLQSSAVYPRLTVREILSLFAGYYPRPRPVDDVIRLVELEEKRDARIRTLSHREPSSRGSRSGARRSRTSISSSPARTADAALPARAHEPAATVLA